jgi:hypothetical protein
MELYEIAAWAMFALIFAFLGMVLGATWKQMENEARAAGVLRRRRSPHGPAGVGAASGAASSRRRKRWRRRRLDL